LASCGSDVAPYNNVVTAFREEHLKKYAKPVEFYEASLEMGRFDGENRGSSSFGGLPDGHAGRNSARSHRRDLRSGGDVSPAAP
jgi:hypothetical protein